MLPAQDILQSFDRVRAVFHNSATAWLKLIQIVAAGDHGVKLSDMRRSDRNAASNSNNLNLVRRWQSAGLVTIALDPRPCGRGRGRQALRIRATPKAAKLLNITPESTHPSSAHPGSADLQSAPSTAQSAT